MKPERRINRRQFLVMSTTAAGALALAACAKEPTEAPVAPPTAVPEQATAAPATSVPEQPATAEPVAETTRFKEAPQLAALVASGELPPLEERIPLNPVVVEPREKVGKYGGTWTSGTVEVNGNDIRRNIGYEQLVRWTPAWDGVVPNVCESYSVNEVGNEFTFNLRQGLKWSDGEPFTADDIIFWYEDFVMDADINPVPPTIPYKVEKLDDWTVKWVFEEPQGLFIKQISQIGHAAAEYPKHYLQQFHIKYNPDANELAKEAGQATWSDNFAAMDEAHQNADLPKLWAWIPTVGIGSGSNRISCKRNPYYFKVDTDGNQLPYIDQYNQELVSDVEVLVLKGLNGELDFQEQWINLPKNKPVFYDNQDKGGYHFWEVTPTYVGECVIQLNRFCTDPVKAEIFSNKDFRIGLSYAMDRQELIDVVMVGQGAPAQAAPRPDSPYYRESLSKQYTEYDVDKANEHLDKAGYTERDSEGFRLGPDGKRISFILEIDQARQSYVDMLELIKPKWAAVGVEMNVKLMERSLWEERCRGRNLEFHGSAHKFGGGAGESVFLDPRFWFPNTYGNCMYAKSWGAWYQNPDDEIAVEPPADVKKSMELWRELLVTADETKQVELLNQVLDICEDQFYHIGTVLEPNSYGIVTNRMRNTPESLPLSWIYPTPNPSNTCQFYIEE